MIRESSCITLPSDRTLRDYTHYFENKAGFNVHIDQQLMEEIDIENIKEHEKYVCLIADEMRIKEGVVFSKSQNELVGFTDLGDINQDIVMLENNLVNNTTNTLATTVFVIMIRGLTIKFNFPYASFPAHHPKGEEIASLMLEATFRLERLGLKVIAHTLDGCSINRKYFKLMTTETGPLPYKMANPFTTDKRYIYFFSDPPHLIKTTRNCFHNPRRQLEVW